jgi:hypothetical protein
LDEVLGYRFLLAVVVVAEAVEVGKNLEWARIFNDIRVSEQELLEIDEWGSRTCCAMLK